MWLLNSRLTGRMVIYEAILSTIKGSNENIWKIMYNNAIQVLSESNAKRKEGILDGLFGTHQ